MEPNLMFNDKYWTTWTKLNHLSSTWAHLSSTWAGTQVKRMNYVYVVQLLLANSLYLVPADVSGALRSQILDFARFNSQSLKY